MAVVFNCTDRKDWLLYVAGTAKVFFLQAQR